MKAIAVLGPTASGKSAIAMHLAARFGGEIVSVDSMQVYRGMDIGTAKPTNQDRERIAHHLIDVADPGDVFTVADFQERGRHALENLAREGIVPIIVGGSGLHFRALVDPMTFAPSDAGLRTELERRPHADLVVELLAADSAAAEHVDLGNPRRVVRAVEIHRLTGSTPSVRAASPEAAALRSYEPHIPVVAIGADPGDSLHTRATHRFDSMLAAGLLDEVADLAPRLGRAAAQAVGYKELIPVAAGERSPDEGRSAAIQATFALAKRQRTFFRRDPRIRWMTWHDDLARRVSSAAAIVTEELQWTS